MPNRECQKLVSRLVRISVVLCLCSFFIACGSTSSFLAKGEEYLQKRKFHDALMQFRSAVESDPASAKAHWGMARAYENLGQFNETVEELRKTVELDDANLEAKAKLGNYFLLVRPPMIPETETLRDEILTADPSFIEGHILSASIMAAQGRPDAEVVAAVNKAIALNPKRIESYISLERLYVTREKIGEAEAAIKNGLAQCPPSVTGFTEYGRFLMYAERDAEAEAQFQKAIETDPSSIEAEEAIAEFFVTSRQMDKAEAAYLRLVQIQENSPESRLELADFYDKAGRKDDAISVLDQILGEVPEYALARYRLGQVYLDRKDFGKVNEQLEILLKINNEDTEALMLRARLNLQENKPDEAITDVEQVLKKTPSAKEPLFLMAQSRLALNQIDPANAFIADLDKYHPSYLKTYLLKIQSAFAVGDSNAALKVSNELVDKATATVPDAENDPLTLQDLRVRGISSRGLAYLDLGKIAEAKADLQNVVQMSPRSASALVNLAKVFVATRDNQAALDLYEKALAMDVQNFDAATGVVNASIALGNVAYAHTKTADLMEASSGSPNTLAALHYLNSTIYSAEKNAAAAESELKTAIGLDESYLPAYSAYASLLAGQNRTDEAIAQYVSVIEKKPAAPIFTLLGILEDSRGGTAAAENYYRQALSLSPDNPIAANNLAWLIADHQGNLDEALQLATTAVSKNANVAGFFDTLGWVYLKKGLPLPAVEQFKKAVALEDMNAQKTRAVANPGYRMRLGMAFAMAGDKLSARREVEASLRDVDGLTQGEAAQAKNVLANL